jgi:Domain of unknown function (DUF4407)
MNVLQKFLILCSGANLGVLQKTPTEWNKFAGIGGIILFTALFASFSATYAMIRVFDDFYISLAIGFVWGLMIFNLDRYIVASIKKTSPFWQQVLMAIPRLVLATFLGIIISKPLEIKIFEKEINKQLNVIVQRQKNALHGQIDQRSTQDSELFSSEKTQIIQRTKWLEASLDSATVDLEKEILGKNSSLTSGKVGFGSHAKRKQELKQDRQKTLDDYRIQSQKRLDLIDENLLKIKQNYDQEFKRQEKTEDQFNGLAACMQALDELAKLQPIMATASFFILMLFVCLEISPVLVKLIAPVGPYDWLMEAIEQEIKIDSQEKIKGHKWLSMQRLERFFKDKTL